MMVTLPTNRTLTFTAGWLIYAMLLSLSMEKAQESNELSVKIGGYLGGVILPYLAGGFASDFAPVQILTYAGAALFLATLVFSRLRYRALANLAFLVVVGTSLFAIWLDKYVSLQSGITDFLISLVTGGLFKVFDIVATVFWLIAWSRVGRAINQEFSRPVAGCAGEASPLKAVFYGVVMYVLALVIGIAAMTPLHTMVALLSRFDAEYGLKARESVNAYEIGKVLGLLPLVYFGLWQDRLGLRRSMIFAILLLGAGCGLTSLAWNPVTLGIGVTCLSAFGFALALAAANTLAFWYDKRLGLMEGALGLKYFVISNAIMPNLLANLAFGNQVSWRWILVGLGIAQCVVLIPLIWCFYRNRPEEIGKQRDGETESSQTPEAVVDAKVAWTALLRSSTFWTVLAGLVLLYLLTGEAANHLLQSLPDKERNPLALFTELTLFTVIGSLVGGWLVDRWTARWVLAPALLLAALGMAIVWQLWPILLPMEGLRAVGFAEGVFVTGSSPLWPRWFGRLHLGLNRATLMTLSLILMWTLGFSVHWAASALGSVASQYLALAVCMVACMGVARGVREPGK